MIIADCLRKWFRANNAQQGLSVFIKNRNQLKILFGQWKRLRKKFSEMYFTLFDLFIQKQGKDRLLNYLY